MPDTDAPPKPGLPPLGGSERALVARFPLPDNVPDVLVNKNQLAAALDVSTTTMDKWLIAPEGERIPFVERGTNGRSYVFRLSVAYAWRQARDAAEDAERELADNAVAQMRLELLGGSTQDRARAALSPKEQAEALRVEKEWILAAAARRDFIRASEVATELETAFAAIRDGFDAAPDRIARELSLDGAAVEAITDILDRILSDARATLVERLTGQPDGEG